jgi:hypothetical protein
LDNRFFVLFSFKGGRRKFVGEIFVGLKSKFLMYGQFCAALPKAQQALDALCSKSDATKEDVARCEQVHKNQVDDCVHKVSAF